MNNKRSPLKEKQFRRPGQFLEEKVDDIRWNIAAHYFLSFLFVAVAFLEWWQWYRNLPPSPTIFGIVALVIVVYSSVRIRKWQKQLHSYRLGLFGEREVSQILNKLATHGYTIFNDVLAPSFNIDHVVISPQGIFAIETKTYSKPSNGKVEPFDGKEVKLTGYLPDAKPIMETVRHAEWLRKNVLKEMVSTKKLFDVKPVVVFPGWWVPRGYNGNIWVLNPGMVETEIEGKPILLTNADIDRAISRLEPYSPTPTDDSITE